MNLNKQIIMASNKRPTSIIAYLHPVSLRKEIHGDYGKR